ncbi:MAG: PorP/SprF family type IX secretion system membrane protein [Bacteroidota bacterium]
MIRTTTLGFKPFLFFLGIFVLLSLFIPNIGYSQDENPYVAYDVPFQNLMKFNRFLINPTFSAVREDKTYINLFHRSQSSEFEDNDQNYFLSYSARINDRTGLGLSFYNQQSGVISNVGIMANYAHGIRLGRKTDLSFGFNLPYYVSKLDQGRTVALEEDPLLSDLDDSSVLSFQPGLNLSLGKFDFGVFAQNLFDFDLKSGQQLTGFNQKTFSGHLQYAHEFKNGAGIFEDGRIMPLARARVESDQDPIFGGGVILDLPKLGWIQGGYDEFYGASAGTGFNLSKRLSFGYNFEKNLNNNLENLGVTHEISLAYSFVPNLSKNTYASDDSGKQQKKAAIVENLKKPERMAPAMDSFEGELEKLKKQQETNLALIDELIFKLDSIETHQQRDLERRFEMAMRLLRKERNPKSTVDESKAAQLFFAKNSGLAEAQVPTRAVAQKNSVTKRKGVFVGGAFKPIEKYITLEGIGKGHYIVANVFGNVQYLQRFVKKLKDEGLDPKYFKNPENGLNYVYLANYDNDAEARLAYESNLGGKYHEEIWIMHVTNPHYSNYADSPN